jgi:hypothetical protein
MRYDFRVHTHAMFDVRAVMQYDLKPYDGQPLEITMVVGRGDGERVWLKVYHSFPLLPGCVCVGDGLLNSGIDDFGRRLMSLPSSLFTFLTTEEANGITELNQIANRLMGWSEG